MNKERKAKAIENGRVTYFMIVSRQLKGGDSLLNRLGLYSSVRLEVRTRVAIPSQKQ